MNTIHLGIFEFFIGFIFQSCVIIMWNYADFKRIKIICNFKWLSAQCVLGKITTNAKGILSNNKIRNFFLEKQKKCREHVRKHIQVYKRVSNHKNYYYYYRKLKCKGIPVSISRSHSPYPSELDFWKIKFDELDF